jgi:hypothetical protein
MNGKNSFNINNIISLESTETHDKQANANEEDDEQFERWKWFWQQRTYPEGKIPDINHYYNFGKQVKKNKDKQLNPVWTFIGPEQSSGGLNGIGRVNVVKTDPKNENIFWAGAASGGLWKSTDAGQSWTTNTDDFSSLGISDIAIQPNNGKVIYIATGDADAASTFSTGVIKSDDGGKTWETTGLTFKTSELKRIYKLVMHPSNYKVLFAAGNNGIDMTTDGGRTWNNILQGLFYDFEIKPGDAKTLYAVGTKFYKSTDGGKYWEQMTNGWPASNVTRVSIAVTPIAPNNVYALCSGSDHGFAGFFVSTNSGYTWQNKSNTPNILGRSVTGSDAGGQGWYDLCLAVSPIDANIVYAGGINIWRSEDAGGTWELEANWYPTTGAATVHADHHDLWFVSNSSTLFSANDGGVYRKRLNANWEWLGSGMGITQFYRLGCASDDSSRIIAGCQDNGTKLKDGDSFRNIRVGDGMDCLIDYSDSDVMYASIPYGTILRSLNNGRNFSGIRPPGSYGNWVTPFVQHPSAPATLFAAMNEVYKTTNRGDNWTTISDFKIPDKKALHFIALAPSNPDVIYTGRGDGLFKVTTDGGLSWHDISRPVDLWITSIAVSPHNPDLIYITLSGYTENEKVYRSTNAGNTWENISGNLPNVPFNIIVCETNTPNRIYAGCDIGVFYRDDTQDDWIKYSEGLPNTVVSDLEIHYGSKMLRASTYGRGLWQAELIETEINAEIYGDTNVCSGTAVKYSTESFPGIENKWVVTNGNIEDNSTSDTVTVIWNNSGSGKIKLIQELNGNEKADSVEKQITITESPVALIEGPDTVCNKSVFIYSSGSGNFKKKWAVTGGTIMGSDSSETVKVYFESDSGAIIKLRSYTDISNCSDSAEKIITLNKVAKPPIKGATKVCANSGSIYSSEFQDELIPLWKAEGGSIINNTGKQITVKWNETGTGEVILTLINQNTGCRDSTRLSVFILPQPLADISGDFITCTNTEEAYGTSINDFYQYKWTAEGGRITSADTVSKVNVIWENEGNNKLILVKTDTATNCQSDTTINITTNIRPEADIGGTDTVCMEQAGEYYALAVNENNILWEATGGIIEENTNDSTVIVKWTESGIGTVKLILTNDETACSDTTKFNVIIHTLPAAEFSGILQVCPGCEEKYFVNFTGYINKWVVEGGSLLTPDNKDTISIKWNTTGTGKITLSQTSQETGCSLLSEKTVSISETNKPGISGDTSVCTDDIYIYTTTSSDNYENVWSAENGEIIGSNNSYSVIVIWKNPGQGKILLSQTNITTHEQNSYSAGIAIYAKPPKPAIAREGYSLRSDATTGNQWYLGDNKIAGATAQYFIPDRNGIYRVRTANDKGCLSEFSDEYNFIIGSVYEKHNEPLLIYPNPANNELHIVANFPLTDFLKVKIVNMLGEECNISDINVTKNVITLNMNCINGYYMFILQTDAQIYRRPFVINK